MALLGILEMSQENRVHEESRVYRNPHAYMYGANVCEDEGAGNHCCQPYIVPRRLI